MYNNCLTYDLPAKYIVTTAQFKDMESMVVSPGNISAILYRYLSTEANSEMGSQYRYKNDESRVFIC